MSALLSLDDGSFVPLRSIGKIGPPDRDGRRTVRDHDGHTIGRIGEYAFNDARTAGLPIIPAPPGWLVVEHSGPDDAEFWSSSEPAVGFIADGGFLVPITPSWGVGWNLRAFFILAPPSSGATMRAFADDETSYPDENAALEAAERKWRELRHRKTGEGVPKCVP
jgi:hypothetical protein